MFLLIVAAIGSFIMASFRTINWDFLDEPIIPVSVETREQE